MITRKLRQSRSKLDQAIIACVLVTLGVNLFYLVGQMQESAAFAVFPGAGALA